MTRNEIIANGSEWQGGEHSRVYLNCDDCYKLIGLEVSYYNSGSIKSATLNGDHLSNSKTFKLTVGFDAYLDRKTGKIEGKHINHDMLTMVRNSWQALA